MLLSDNEIRSRNLIINSVSTSFRAASYDLTVGKIINMDAEEVHFMDLEPQGIVEVISHEKVKLPGNIVGYAMVKTSLCSEGILPLNIGIIDPGYEGFLSATILNFSKRTFKLEPGQVFLRITFHECLVATRSISSPPLSEDEYVRKRKVKVSNFSKTFLNFESTVQKVSEPIINRLKGEIKGWLFAAATAAAIILAIFPFLVTLGVDYTSRTGWTREQFKAEILQEIRQQEQEQLKQQIQELEEQIQELRREQQQNQPQQQQKQE